MSGIHFTSVQSKTLKGEKASASLLLHHLRQAQTGLPMHVEGASLAAAAVSLGKKSLPFCFNFASHSLG